VCASIAVFLTSNPLYLSLAFLVAAGVYVSVGASKKGKALFIFVVMGLALASLTIPLNVLTGSSGSTVLAELPEARSPGWLGGVILGGDVTAEALVTATARALTIATLVLLAAAFNASIDHFRLLRLAPRAFAPLMLMLTIAALVVPQSIAHGRSVAEARRLRGHRASGLRALPSLLLPTLQGALERSVRRAESLDARGFAGGRNGGALSSIAGVAGVALCAWGAFAHFYSGVGIGPSVTAASGIALIAAALWDGGGARSYRLRVDRWSNVDFAVVVAAFAGLALVLVLRLTGTGDANYVAYPHVTAPAFHPAGAGALLLLLTPGVLHRAQTVERDG
jgi:energy-coupling factor transport system permease protein